MRDFKAEYAEKLKDPRWLELKNAFTRFKISERNNPDDPYSCEDCGEEPRSVESMHVHHRRYTEGKEPWQYAYKDLRLICAKCHEHIHASERRARTLILMLEPNECDELNDFLEELEIAQRNGMAKVALARAKNGVRSVNPQR